MIDPGALAAQVTKLTVESMKAKNVLRTETLRMIKTALMNKAVEKNAALTPAEEQATLVTMIKQRRDSIDAFTKGGRPALAEKEAAEIVIVEEFLPKALDEAGLKALVAATIEELTAANGAKPDAKAMGQVIKAVQAKIAAQGVRAEGRLVSEAVKAALA